MKLRTLSYYSSSIRTDCTQYELLTLQSGPSSLLGRLSGLVCRYRESIELGWLTMSTCSIFNALSKPGGLNVSSSQPSEACSRPSLSTESLKSTTWELGCASVCSLKVQDSCGSACRRGDRRKVHQNFFHIFTASWR